MKNCPYCSSDKIVSIEQYNWKGHKVKSEVFECKNCKEIHIPNTAIKEIEEINRLVSGLLLPEEIRLHRIKVNKTQQEIADSLGIGLKTYLRWENGHVYQTKAHDNQLRQYFEDKLYELEKQESTSKWLDKLTKGTLPKFPYVIAAHSKGRLNPELNKKIRKIFKKHG